MRVRHIVHRPKTLESDTGWHQDDLPPRHAPHFSRTLPVRRHWKWRSLAATDADGREYVLVVRINIMKGDWQSVLCQKMPDGDASVVGRFEYHEDHPGTHLHSHCERSGVEVGAAGLSGLGRFPANHAFHRRKTAWTENSFLEASKRFFRIRERKGELL